mgnify:FL=1
MKKPPLLLTSHAEIALSPTESQTTPSKSKAQTLPREGFEEDAAAIFVEEVEVDVVKQDDFDRRAPIPSRGAAPARVLLSSEPMLNCVPLLKRAPSCRSIERERKERKRERRRRRRDKEKCFASIEITSSCPFFLIFLFSLSSPQTIHPNAPCTAARAPSLALPSTRKRPRLRRRG